MPKILIGILLLIVLLLLFDVDKISQILEFSKDVSCVTILERIPIQDYAKY